MADIEKAIRILEGSYKNFVLRHNGELITVNELLALLKAQEPATIEPKRIDLADETKAWLDKMDAVDALGNIADICIDWDGYRTANGLGGLINEIWAYARYCADRLLKAQEPVKPCTERDGRTTFFLCGSCNKPCALRRIATSRSTAQTVDRR